MVDKVATVDPDSLLGQVASEFFDRLAKGEQPDPEEYAREYPQIAEHIRRTFPAMEVIGESLSDGSPCGEQVDLEEHRRLGDFRIRREIGRGGMGVVYEAEQLSMGRTVALKVLPFVALVDDKPLQRFRNEVRAAATLQHPNIVSVYSVGEERGVHYYAMQLVRGQTLAEVIGQLRKLRDEQQKLDGSSISQVISAATSASADSRAEPTEAFPPGSEVEQARIDTHTATSAVTWPSHNRHEFYRSVAALGIQAARALQHAHEQGVVHRDIKPGNLMLDTEGQLWVTDFGLARIEADPGVTMTGDLIGTLRYMSPEQALGKRIVVDNRADVYSLAATLYELLTLRPVFLGQNRGELLQQIATRDPIPLRRIDRAAPRELETIVQTGLSKDPEERYPTAAELCADLQRFLDDEPILAKPPGIVQRCRKWARRRKAIVYTATATCAVSLLLGGMLLWQEHGKTLSALEAEKQQRRIAQFHEAEAKKQAKAAQAARDAETVARQEEEKQGRIARENFQRARAAVDRYLTARERRTVASSSRHAGLAQRPSGDGA